MELDLMFLKKTPPHSLEAERTVLGGILVQNQSLNVVLSTISPEDFYIDAHRKILERIISLVDKGLPVDLLTGQLRAEGGRRRAAQFGPDSHRRDRRTAHQAGLPPDALPDRAGAGDHPENGGP